MSQSGLRLPTTKSEADVRELVRAKLRAKAALEAHFSGKGTAIMSEDELIDHELEATRLARAVNAAEDAMYKAMREAV